MQTTIKIFDTMEEANNAAIQLYKLYKCVKHHNMSFSCNHNDREYAIVRHGFELYIFTTKNELCKVMEKIFGNKYNWTKFENGVIKIDN